MNGQPPAEVWYVEYRWVSGEAAGGGTRFFATRMETEEFLHFCYVSQFSPGEVMSPTLITRLSDGAWEEHTFLVVTHLGPKASELFSNDEAVTNQDRGFAQLPDSTVQQTEPAPPLAEGT